MTDDKKHDDKDRKKLSDEELEDVAGGALASSSGQGFSGLKGKKKKGTMERSVDIDATGTHYEN